MLTSGLSAVFIQSGTEFLSRVRYERSSVRAPVLLQAAHNQQQNPSKHGRPYLSRRT
jgi:hypothetical protein